LNPDLIVNILHEQAAFIGRTLAQLLAVLKQGVPNFAQRIFRFPWYHGKPSSTESRQIPSMTQPLIVHASSKSLIETPRRVLHIEYAARMVMADSLELAMA